MAKRGRQRTVAWVVAVCALCLSLGACAEKDDIGPWTPFAPEGAGFSILMPGLPTQDRDVAPKTGTGDIDVKSYTVDPPQGGLFSVVVTVLPEATVVKGNTDEILDSACDYVAKSAGGTLTGKRIAMLEDSPGREFTVDVPESAVPGGGALRGRIFLVDRTMYQIIAIVPRARKNSSAPGRFLDSFQLVTKK